MDEFKNKDINLHKCWQIHCQHFAVSNKAMWPIYQLSTNFAVLQFGKLLVFKYVIRYLSLEINFIYHETDPFLSKILFDLHTYNLYKALLITINCLANYKEYFIQLFNPLKEREKGERVYQKYTKDLRGRGSPKDHRGAQSQEGREVQNCCYR